MAEQKYGSARWEHKGSNRKQQQSFQNSTPSRGSHLFGRGSGTETNQSYKNKLTSNSGNEEERNVPQFTRSRPYFPASNQRGNNQNTFDDHNVSSCKKEFVSNSGCEERNVEQFTRSRAHHKSDQSQSVHNSYSQTFNEHNRPFHKNEIVSNFGSEERNVEQFARSRAHHKSDQSQSVHNSYSQTFDKHNMSFHKNEIVSNSRNGENFRQFMTRQPSFPKSSKSEHNSYSRTFVNHNMSLHKNEIVSNSGNEEQDGNFKQFTRSRPFPKSNKKENNSYSRTSVDHNTSPCKNEIVSNLGNEENGNVMQSTRTRPPFSKSNHRVHNPQSRISDDHNRSSYESNNVPNCKSESSVNFSPQKQRTSHGHENWIKDKHPSSSIETSHNSQPQQSFQPNRRHRFSSEYHQRRRNENSSENCRPTNSGKFYDRTKQNYSRTLPENYSNCDNSLNSAQNRKYHEESVSNINVEMGDARKTLLKTPKISNFQNSNSQYQSMNRTSNQIQNSNFHFECFNNSFIANYEGNDNSNDGGLQEELNYNPYQLLVNVSNSADNLNFWENYFIEHLPDEHFVVAKSSTDTISLEFASLSKAKKAEKMLLKHRNKKSLDPRITGVYRGKHNVKAENREIIKKFAQMFHEKKESYFQYHEKKIMAVEKKLEFLKSKLPGIRNKNAAESEISILEEKLQELEEQYRVFHEFECSILHKLMDLYKATKNCLKDTLILKTDFARECACFVAGLPIYSKKDIIINLVLKKKVVILVAETGSGKSTQLTQYLWRSHLFSKGLIACAQPRKVAAVSLAQYVSGQIGDVVGNTIGYKIGTESKCIHKTKVLYITDYMLLKESMVDNFSKYSVIIVDEAHERNLFTDLLLSMIKKCLSQRNDLKVIITSATINPKVFLDYFDIDETCLLTIPGRLYPIQEVWMEEDVQLDWNYLQESVNVASNIHSNEKPGDILVFLATPYETETAVDLFRDHLNQLSIKESAWPELISFHGKQSTTQQMKIFAPQSERKRKIIFATNCAETSITIHGIRYVIDSGMVNELRYNPKLNNSTLTIGFTNKSSANQRKGRCGRNEPGKCYRLYSKNNYENMQENMIPEIKRVCLSQALLLLVDLGFKDLRTFDFVEPPDRITVDKAMENLTWLGAVINDNITRKGQKMAKIPVEPRFANFILEASKADLTQEAVILTGISEMADKIFIRNKASLPEADSKIKLFCQKQGDFLTYLNVFNQWRKIPFLGQRKWCIENFISAKTMKAILGTVRDLKYILRKEFNMVFIETFADDIIYDKLHRMLIQCFCDNICIFSGHFKLGYISLNQSELFLHPSSSVILLKLPFPQYLVYQNILETSRSFLHNVIPVSADIIEDLSSKGQLQTDIDLIKSRLLLPSCICSVGETILLRDIIGRHGSKMREHQDFIKELAKNKQANIMVNVNKGEIFIHASQGFHDIVEEYLRNIINESKKKLFSEEEVCTVKGISSLRATIGLGGLVKDLILPGDFREILVESLQNVPSPSDLIQNFRQFGDLDEVKELKLFGKRKFRIVFRKAENAKNAFDVLCKRYTLSAMPDHQSGLQNLPEKKSLPVFRIEASWPRRKCSGSAFLRFESEDDFIEVSAQLASRYFCILGTTVKISVSGHLELHVTNLPKIVTEEEIESAIKSLLPCTVNIGRININKEKPFPTTEEDLRNIQQKLQRILSSVVSTSKIMINITKPFPKDINWKVLIFFQNAKEGENVYNSLKGKLIIDNLNVHLKSVLFSEFQCSFNYFTVIKDQVQSAIQSLIAKLNNRITVDIKPICDRKYLRIIIKSDNLHDTNLAYSSFMDILRGDCINCEGIKMLENLFSPSGQSYLKSLEKKFSAYVHLDYRRKIISIFASKNDCCLVRNAIFSYVEKLESSKYYEFNLASDEAPKGLLRELLKHYGFSFFKLQNECELLAVTVDHKNHLLIATGNDLAIKKVKKTLQDFCNNLKLNESAVSTEEADDYEICPICLGNIDINFHRLEYCGHAFCRECLVFQISTKVLPLNCPKENCNNAFVLEDIKKILVGNDELKEELYEVAVSKYVLANSKTVHYCPSPDCPMVYRGTQTETIVVCPVCLNEICARCQSIYHSGMSCDMYMKTKKDENYPLKVWMEQNSSMCKICKKCSCAIEKNGGCNHITCLNCGSHMCWLCMNIFKTAEEVYNHLAYCQSQASAT